MKWISSFFLLSSFMATAIDFSFAAIPTSYRIQHPISWMHLLPVGETPGWISKHWVQVEVSHANVWNAPIDLQNLTTGESLGYTADFEQTHTIVEIGSTLGTYFAHSLVIPYASRSGGFLDRFIDEFHVAFGFDRFNRREFNENQSEFSIWREGQLVNKDTSASGISNLKYKIKFWPWQWKGNTGQCPCGFSVGAQAKLPLENKDRALTTGDIDYSFTVHLGFPLFSQSAIWLSSATTHTPKNDLLLGWPRFTWHQMYEVSSDWALNDNWGLTAQARMESPLLDKTQLAVINNSSEPTEQLLDRIASGWNSLVHWRGSEAFGVRYRSDSGLHQIQLMMIEDWALGNFDESGDDLYVNGAPDVIFSLQYHWAIE